MVSYGALPGTPAALERGGNAGNFIYCVGARFAGGGIGDTAYHAVQGISARGYLKRLLASSDCHDDASLSIREARSSRLWKVTHR